MLINVLRGEFDIAMGFAHSLSPARVLFFGSPAVYIMVLCLLLRATMLTVPTTGFCDLPLTVVGTGANASTQNSSYVPLSDQLGFGGLSARHTSCTLPTKHNNFQRLEYSFLAFDMLAKSHSTYVVMIIPSTVLLRKRKV